MIPRLPQVAEPCGKITFFDRPAQNMLLFRKGYLLALPGGGQRCGDAGKTALADLNIAFCGNGSWKGFVYGHSIISFAGIIP